MVQIILIILLHLILNKYVYSFVIVDNQTHNHPFDLQLYEDVLDPVLCQEQLNYLKRNNTILLAEFIDAGIKIPKGILTGNLRHMGSYYQCLGINRRISNSVIEGKYCSIQVPMRSWKSEPMAVHSLEFSRPSMYLSNLILDNDTLNTINLLQTLQNNFGSIPKAKSRSLSNNPIQGILLDLAVCIPKVCTTKEAISGLVLSKTAIDFSFQENYCRLPNDKHWVLADYVATIIFSLIGLITVLSTSYDVYLNVWRKTDRHRTNTIYITFSIYTNTRKLVKYIPVSGTLECVDGIRALTMLWILMGHTVMMYLSNFMANPQYSFKWLTSLASLWISATPIAVDTFFTLSGLIVVYSTAGKFTELKLLKNLHLFYLNRVLRMYPVLATFVLLQASFLNRVSDGPDWNIVVTETHKCRVHWWTTLLFIQNYLHADNVCLVHTWYLAIDTQLYFISPIVLFWILTGKKRYSWAALIIALLCAMISASIYNIKMKFPAGLNVPTRLDDNMKYMFHYYINTLPRSPPFFIGMVFGYILHLNRNQKVILSKLQVAILWICAAAITCTVMYSSYPIQQMDWDNQTIDTMINCLIKPAWALAIGLFIFACTHGYSGPINWFLSLRLWKIPSRLSYAMYIVHNPLMFVINSSTMEPVYFSAAFTFMKFINIFTLTIAVSFIVVVLIDAPCSVLIKRFLGTGINKRQNQQTRIEVPISETIRGSV